MQTSARSKRSHVKLNVLLTYGVLVLFLLASIAPFVYSILRSLLDIQEAFRNPTLLAPHLWDMDNYFSVIRDAPFARFLLNSTIITVCRVVLSVTFATMAGYVFATKRFPGRDALFFGILFLMVIPREATVVPLFVIMRRFPFVGGNDLFGMGGTGFVDTYAGMILPFAVQAFDIFVMRQFFWTMPGELEEAAKLDGANQWQIFMRIAVPFAVPGIIAVGIFSFQSAWNDFIWPLIITRSIEMQPVQVGLQTFSSDAQQLGQWGILLAAVVMSTLPMLVIFVIFQRYFFSGISFAGVNK